MRTRLVFVSLLAGFITSLVLNLIFAQTGSSDESFATSTLTSSFAWVGYGLASILLFSGVYVASKLEWPRSRGHSMRLGAISGFLAASTVYLFSGAPAIAGALGSKEIFLSTLRRIESEREGILLLANGVTSSAWWGYGVFWGILLGGIFLGSLGGLLTGLEGGPGWGKPPAYKGGHLNRMVVYAVGFFAVMSLLFSNATYALLSEQTIQTLKEHSAPGLETAQSILWLPIASNEIWIAICAYFAIWWVFEDWQNPELRRRTRVKIALFAALMILFYLSNINLGLLTTIILTAIALLIVIIRLMQTSSPPEEPQTSQKFLFHDYASASLAMSISLVALLMGSVISHAYSMVAFIIPNVEHLTLSGPPETDIHQQIKIALLTTQQMSLWLVLGLSIFSFLAIMIIHAIGWLTPPQSSPQTDKTTL
jgi:hypothetical protein